MEQFKPLLLPNKQPEMADIQYPMMASVKLDGIRCVFLKGKMVTRSLKPIPNKQLQQKYIPLKNYTEKYGLIIDGELYSHELTFQEITHYVMTKDLSKKGETLPVGLKFCAFDMIKDDNYKEEFETRYNNLQEDPVMSQLRALPYYVDIVNNIIVDSPNDLIAIYNRAKEQDYEGLIVRSPYGRYKRGRLVFGSGDGYKFKPYRTFDGEIIEVLQATSVKDGAESKINELGRSVTSKKKDDRIPIKMASGFRVNYEDTTLKVTLALTKPEKIEIWRRRKNYIGKHIEYKGMLVGAKNVPRHPVMIRFRKDKDEQRNKK